MIKKESRNSLRKQRHLRTKNKIFGTKECPRLNVFKSNTNVTKQTPKKNFLISIF